MAIKRKSGQEPQTEGLPKLQSPLDSTSYDEHTESLTKYINNKVAKHARKIAKDFTPVKEGDKLREAIAEAKKQYKGVFKSMEVGVNRKLATALYDGAEKMANTGRLRRDSHRKIVLDGLTENVKFYTESYFRRIVEPKLKAFVAKNKDSPTFNKDFSALLKRSLTDAGQYWGTVSDTVAGRSFHYGLLKGAQGRGYTNFFLVAIIDNRTTPFCKSIHGKRFPIQKALEDIEDLCLLKGKDVLHGPWALVSEGKASSVDMKKMGFTTPPFHCNCRTRVRVE